VRRFGLVVVVVAFAASLAPAQAAPRPGAPSAQSVVRAVGGVAGATPFAAGRRVARRARRAVTRRQLCAASKLLGRHHALTDRQLRRAERRRARARIARLKAGDRRGVKARTLVLRSLPAGKACGGAASVAVDSAVRPVASLPSVGGSGPRPMARAVDAYGNTVDFVANELVLIGTDAEVQALVRRWNGRILATEDLTRLGGTDKLFLVRIEVSRADETRLAADLAKLSEARGEVMTVSSEQGLDAIAAAGREARGGRTVGLNVVGESMALATGGSFEAPDGPSGFLPGEDGWSPNAFRWSHLSTAGIQATGTAEAWRLLARAGRTADKVGLAVLDMGFSPLAQAGDFGSPLDAISNVPFHSALETSNLSNCGSPCPWHGSNVANTAFAVPDNGLGVAGTGGPVARPIVVFTSYDFYTSIGALVSAADAGADVVNMSFGARVPAALAWTVVPFEVATKIAQVSDMTLIASAGNKKTNVDDKDCFLSVCWEEAWWTPCENAGVLCVGALGHDSKERADYTNRGRRGNGQVELFAPGTVLVGLDPATPSSAGPFGVHSVSGTSFAAPYIAGVAALVRAADPGLTQGDVERILLATARTSPDLDVGKYVNALAAVRSALPRMLNIERPRDGDSLAKGGTVELSAFVHDPGDGLATITWTLVDGPELGRGPTISTTLPYGPHRIRARAVFSNGGVAVTDEVAVTITNNDPVVRIRQPTAGSTFVQGETVQLLGESEDINQPESGGRLRDAQMAWFLDGSTTPLGTGTQPTLDLTGASTGAHTITLRGTDDAGATATTAVGIQVEAAGPNQPPTVSITSPANDEAFVLCCNDAGGFYANVDFQADVTDPDGDPLTYEWTEAIPGSGFPTATRSTDEDAGTQKVYFKGCGSDQGHDWTLSVSDGTYVRTATVHVTLTGAVC
jgi:hypothetical protein